MHVGRWANGEPEGKGERHERRSGVLYRGCFAGAKLHGQGEEVLPGGMGAGDVPARGTGAPRAVAER